LLLLCPASAIWAQGSWDLICGGLGQVACNSNDKYYSSVYFNKPSYPFVFNDQPCDLALAKDKDGLCGNFPGPFGGVRYLLANSYKTGWSGFAQAQQRGAIQADQAMNWINILGTHNSYSNYQDGAYNSTEGGANVNVDQYYSISDQMDAGARLIRLDPITYEVVHGFSEDKELRMCHASGSDQTVCATTSTGRLFASGVQEVQEWLNRNPGEVLVVRMYRVQESDVPVIDKTIIYNVQMSGGAINVLVPPNQDYFTDQTWNPATQGWPTLRQMRSMGKNLIFLSDTATDMAYPWGGSSTGNVVNDSYTDYSNFSRLRKRRWRGRQDAGVESVELHWRGPQRQQFFKLITRKAHPGCVSGNHRNQLWIRPHRGGLPSRRAVRSQVVSTV
jgi:hypothetical protein